MRRRHRPRPALHPDLIELIARLRGHADRLEGEVGDRRDDEAYTVWQEACEIRWKADALEVEGFDPPRVFLAYFRARVELIRLEGRRIAAVRALGHGRRGLAGGGAA